MEGGGPSGAPGAEGLFTMADYTKPIMVVDDDSMVVSMLQDTLEDSGYQVLSYTSAKTAVAALPDTEVELVITDYHMPEMTGLDLLKAVNILQDELGRRMAVIVLSAQKDAKIALELVKNSAFSYQSKPLDIQKLLLDVQRAITKLMLP